MRSLVRSFMAVAVAAVVSGSAMAQRPMQQPGNRGTDLSAMVLTNAELQKELKVTDEQKSKFKEVSAKQEEYRKKFSELFQGGGARPDRAKMQELQAEGQKVREEAKKLTEEVLTSDQKKRIKQIQVQMQGVRAFANADIVKELNISDDQKTKIKEITDEYAKASRELGGGRPMVGGQRPTAEQLAESRKKRTELSDKTIEKIAAELTAEQKKIWADMIGEKVDTSKFTPALGGRPMTRVDN